MHTEKPGLSTLFVKSGVQNRWELQSKDSETEHLQVEKGIFSDGRTSAAYG
jgi:hypothetical protein